ncbi:hypothetical protein [Formosa sp. A9]|uniref:hypothetical protein n=1 Tax=Formosa sp. A9 TaxID=3442641 RepID=UPI003EBB2DBA
MHKTQALLLLLFSLFACSTDQIPDAVEIRLLNDSPYNFENIVVNTSTTDVDFNSLSPGEFSAYKTFEKAYRYAFIELQIEGETYTIQPIDYVGESPLNTGYYTYQINANDSKEQYHKLQLTLITD